MPILDEDFLSLYSNILSGFLGMLFAFLKQYSDGKPVANQVLTVVAIMRIQILTSISNS